MVVDISEYKVGVIKSLEACGNPKAGKSLKACTVDIGESNDDGLIQVVTAAPNVREGSRVAVCPVGSFFINEEGEEVKVEKTTVGGVVSEGILCDARMLGWSTNSGIAVQMPDSLPLGSSPPPTKPRPNEEGSSDLPASKVEGLFEKKLTKEEKKKIAEEKRKARKAAKEAKAQGD